MTRCAFTVDLENPALGGIEGARALLNFFDAEAMTASFFTVAELAEDHRGLLEEIAARGHEIACHGLTHPDVHLPPGQRSPFLTELSEAAFDAALARAVELLTVGGRKPAGFRAPWLRIDPARRRIVARHFAYDSSLTNARRSAPPDGLVDLPVSAASRHGPHMASSVLLGLPRMAAGALIDAAFARLAPGEPFVLYTHSYDPVRLKAPVRTAWWKRVHYYDRCGPAALDAARFWIDRLRAKGGVFGRLDACLETGRRP